MIIRNKLDDFTEKDLRRKAAVHAIINEEIAKKLTARGSSIGIKLSSFKDIEGGLLSNSEVDSLILEIKTAGWVVEEKFSHDVDAMILQISPRKAIEPSL